MASEAEVCQHATAACNRAVAVGLVRLYEIAIH